MTTISTEGCCPARQPAHYRTISPQKVQTLQDLLDAIQLQEPDPRHLVAMLRATAGHIALYFGKEPHLIEIRELVDCKPGFQTYLRAKDLRRNSIRSYTNYLRILLQEARELGWVECAPEIRKAWDRLLLAVKKEDGCCGIVRYAIRKGIGPTSFTEASLSEWAETAIRDGRTFVYVQRVKSLFRRCIFQARLNSDLPNLLPPVVGYGIPVSKFPEPLCLQVSELLRWKTARFSPGRPNKGKHRLISARNLQALISRLFGFLVKIKGRTVCSLGELFSEQNVSNFVEWAVNENRISGPSLAIELGKIRALGTFPPLADCGFSWIPKLASQLPRDFETRTTKERKWVSYDLLAQIAEQIRHDADANPSHDEASKAAMFRDALLIEWLTTLPWRQRNIRECRIMPFSQGGNLFKEMIPAHSTIAKSPWVEETLRANSQAMFWQFYFRSEETKTGIVVHAMLPRQLIGPLEEYLDRYRPLLLNGADPRTLFLNLYGRPLSSQRVEHIVGDLTLKYSGRRVNPHLFRDIFAVKWLEDHAEDYLTLSKILWHRNIQTTLQVYGRNYDESHGARSVEMWLETRRRKKP